MIESVFTKSHAAVLAGSELLDVALVVPASPEGLVVVAHAGPASGCSTCRLWLVEQLNRARFATCLVDLDAVARGADSKSRFTWSRPAVLAKRLSAVIQWLARDGVAGAVPIGCFVEGEVAAAGFACAAAMPGLVAAIVSSGGRLGAVRTGWREVKAATLFIETEGDEERMGEINDAYRRLTCPKRLEVLPSSKSRFAALGATEHVPQLASAWFAAFLRQVSARPSSRPGRPTSGVTHVHS